MDNTKEKKKKTGRVLRFFPCLIVLFGTLCLVAAAIACFFIEDGPTEILLPVAIGFLVLTVLLFVSYHYSKHKKWGNNVILALGILFIVFAIGLFGCGIFFLGYEFGDANATNTFNEVYGLNMRSDYLIAPFIALAVSGLFPLLIGICGITGAKRGKACILAELEKSLDNTNVEGIENIAAVQNNAASEDATYNNISEIENGENIDNNEIVGKVADEKEIKKYSKISWICFVITILYYIVWIVLGIFSIVKPENGILWDIENFENITDNYLSGFICLLFVPSVLYYISLASPFNFSKMVRWILFGSGIAISVIGIILYFILLDEYFLICSDANTMKLAPVLSNVGLLLIYVLKLIRIDPSKIQKVKYDKKENIVKKIVHKFTNFGRAILRWRTSATFLVIGTLLFTLLVFVLIQLIYFLLGLLVFTLALAIFFSIFWFASVFDVKKAYIVYKGGTKYYLERSGYDYFYSATEYKDQFGGTWLSKDNSTFFKK